MFGLLSKIVVTTNTLTYNALSMLNFVSNLVGFFLICKYFAENHFSENQVSVIWIK